MMVTIYEYADFFGMDSTKIRFHDDGSIDYDGNVRIWMENNEEGDYFDFVKPICSETIITATNSKMPLNYYQFPFKFNKVNGDFNIYYNNATNLMKSPYKINCFIDMSYMPRYVNGNFESNVFFKNFDNHPLIISKQFRASFIDWDCQITTKNNFKEKFKDSFLTGKGSLIYEYRNNNSYKFYIYDYINRRKFFSDFNKVV